MPGDSGEQAAVLLLHVAMVGDVVVEDGCHLSAPDSGADVRHLGSCIRCARAGSRV